MAEEAFQKGARLSHDIVMQFEWASQQPAGAGSAMPAGHVGAMEYDEDM